MKPDTAPVASTTAEKTVVAKQAAKPVDPVQAKKTLRTLFYLLLLAGAIGLFLRIGAGQPYDATAQVAIDTLDLPGMKAPIAHPTSQQVSDNIQQLLGWPISGKVADVPGQSGEFSLTAEADNPYSASDMVNLTASNLTGAHPEVVEKGQRGEVISVSSPSSATVHFSFARTPPLHLFELGIYVLLCATGLGGLIFVALQKPETASKKRAKPSKAPVKADSVKPSEAPVEAAIDNKLHAILTVTPTSTGSADAPKYVFSDSLKSQIEDLRMEQIGRGILLLVTQALPTNTKGKTSMRYALANGPSATTQLSKELSSKFGFSTLIADTGSKYWSAVKSTPPTDAFDFPDAEGFYQLIRGRGTLEEDLLQDEEITNLSALPSGRMPADWSEQLRSAEVMALFDSMRSRADVTLVYAPHIMEKPETVCVLGDLSDGVILVVGVEPSAVELEQQAKVMLKDGGVAVIGKIELKVEQPAAAVAAPVLPQLTVSGKR